VTAEPSFTRPADGLARQRADIRRGTGIILRTLQRALREPLTHFLVVGLVLFIAVEHHRAQTDPYRIVVTPERVRDLTDRYRMEYGTDPSPATLSQLVDHDVDEEVLYREGLTRKLDQDDEIVRRRVVQKMQFLEQNLAVPTEPNEQRLKTRYRAHRAQYATPATVSFSHIYFADGVLEADAARRRAAAVLAGLSDSIIRAPERGDSFPDLYDYAGIGTEEAGLLFGDSELSRKLFQAPPGRWSGPLRSSYGWHLLRVQSMRPGRIPPFPEVRDRVRADLMAADQEAANRQRFAALKSRFTVAREDGESQP
jgi:peptidyl-prolyl cis-trans isomerase C